MRCIFSIASLALLAAARALVVQPACSGACAATAAPRTTRVLAAAPQPSSEEERLERLRQLFGPQTAEKLTPRRPEPEPEPEVAMLKDGMQQLSWGAVRLVDVAMAAGPLEMSLQPLLSRSQLHCVRLEQPLGLLLEQESQAEQGSASAAVVVVDVLDEGSARGGGVLRGDLVRAVTGLTMAMSYPAWQVMLGGVGKPSLQKVLVAADGKPLEYVLSALASNSPEQQGNGQVILLLERPVGGAASVPVASESE